MACHLQKLVLKEAEPGQNPTEGVAAEMAHTHGVKSCGCLVLAQVFCVLCGKRRWFKVVVSGTSMASGGFKGPVPEHDLGCCSSCATSKPCSSGELFSSL